MRILAVDDEPFIRELLPKFAAKAKFNDVETAESGQVALQIIHESSRPFDCFLLDISMPNMTGIALCENIRALPDYSRTPIIMLSAMVDRHFIDLAFRAGATDYATKPFDLIELGTRLRAAQELNVAQAGAPVGPPDPLDSAPSALNTPDTKKVTILGRGQYLDPDVTRNYLGRLSDDARKFARIYAVMIDGWENLHSQTTEADRELMLAWVGNAVDEVLQSTGYFISYWGDGTFMIVNHNSVQASGKTLETAIKTRMDERRKAHSQNVPPRFDISMGAALRIVDSDVGNVENVFQEAKRLAEQRHLSKSKIAQTFGRLGAMLSGSKRRAF